MDAIFAGNYLRYNMPMASGHPATCRNMQVEEDPTGGKFAGIGGALNSAHHKLEDIIQFHIGDVVTALQRAAMQPGGQEAVIYGTIMGALGAQQIICSAVVVLRRCIASITVVQQHEQAHAQYGAYVAQPLSCHICAAVM